MIGLLPTTTIFLATAPTDLRKAYDGLAVLVRQSLNNDIWQLTPRGWKQTFVSEPRPSG